MGGISVTVDQGQKWLFSNGAAEWARWAVAMLVGAGIAWQALQGRVTSAESEITSLRREVTELRQTVSRLDGNVRDGFTAMNSTILQLHSTQ